MHRHGTKVKAQMQMATYVFKVCTKREMSHEQKENETGLTVFDNTRNVISFRNSPLPGLLKEFHKYSQLN